MLTLSPMALLRVQDGIAQESSALVQTWKEGLLPKLEAEFERKKELALCMLYPEDESAVPAELPILQTSSPVGSPAPATFSPMNSPLLSHVSSPEVTYIDDELDQSSLTVSHFHAYTHATLSAFVHETVVNG